MHNKYGSVLGVGGVKLEPGSARACIVTVTAIQTDDQPDAMALQASRRLRHRRGAAWPAAWSDRRQPLIGYVPRQKAAFEIRPSSHGAVLPQSSPWLVRPAIVISISIIGRLSKRSPVS